MNLAELVEAATSGWELVLSAMGLYMTLVSAYLVAAYLVGNKLTKSQTRIISGIYIVLMTMIVAGIHSWIVRANHYTFELVALEPAAASITIQTMHLYMTAILVVGVLATLKFMWDIRINKGA